MTDPLWTIPSTDGSLLEEARRLADRIADAGADADRPRVVAVVFDGLVDPTDVPLTADEIIEIERSSGSFRVGSAGVRDRASAIQSLADAETDDPGAVLFPSTPDGDELTAVTAARLHGGCVTDCLLRVRDGEFLAGRRAYGGRAFAEISFESGPPVVSLNTDVLDVPERESGEMPPTRSYQVVLEASESIRRVAVRDVPEQDLARARRIVAGGRGLSGPDGFEPVSELAETVGATVGASRPPADEGWVPYDRQIGVTGKEIDVDLYVPCAISGDPYHMRSVNADHLLPINTDPDAPIFNGADLGVVGDVFEYGPVISEAIRRAVSESTETEEVVR